jgi:hypothetical protein
VNETVCDRRVCSAGPDVAALLAGRRLAWTCFESGLNDYENLRVSGARGGGYSQVAYFYADDTGGDYVEAMGAAGRFLVFEVDTVDSSGNPIARSTFLFDPSHRRGGTCPDDGGTETGGHANGCSLLSAAKDCRFLDATRARIAVACPDGQLRILDIAGTVRTRLHVSTSTASARFQDDILVVLDGNSLRQYRTATGRLLHEHALPADIVSASLAGAAGKTAAYVRGTAIHLVRLGTGADVALRPPHVAGSVGASLTAAGLFYTYERAGRGRRGIVGFVPVAKLLRLS